MTGEGRRRLPAGPEHPSILLVVEQLRRAVPGGIGTYADGLLAGLAKLDVSRALAGGEPIALTLLASRVAPDPLAHWGRPIRSSRLASPLLTRAWDLGVSRAPSGFDVVHSVSLAAPALSRGVRGVLAVTVHDLAWRSHPEATTGRGRRWHEAALARTLRRADAFVVPSAAVEGDLVAAGADPDAVSVIGEGSDHLPSPDRAGAEAILRASGIDGPYLLSVATLQPRKNFRRLIEAYRDARSSLPEPLPLVVAGPLGWGDAGFGGQEIEGVVAVGHVEGAALAGLYADAAAFVYVPLAEGFGLPPLEAMVAGVPVVASTAVPSVTEAPGDAPALVVDPTDADAIAGALVAIVSDRELSDSLRARGSAYVATRTWEAAAAGHLALWERLL
jgi:glycosyltransferase involved in cell wall biosynthesis